MNSREKASSRSIKQVMIGFRSSMNTSGYWFKKNGAMGNELSYKYPEEAVEFWTGVPVALPGCLVCAFFALLLYEQQLNPSPMLRWIRLRWNRSRTSFLLGFMVFYLIAQSIIVKPLKNCFISIKYNSSSGFELKIEK